MGKHLPFRLETLDGTRLAGEGDLILELHPYLIYRPRPSQKHPLYIINEHGFRNLLTDHRPKGIILGSSTAFGWPAGDERCWVSRLRRKLEYCERRPYSILNAGVMGYILPQIRRQLTELLLEYRPRWVILVGGWSDWFNVIYHQRPQEFYPYHSTFFHVQGMLGSGMHWESHHPVPLQKHGSALIHHIEKEIHAIFRLCHSFDVPCLFVYQPHLIPPECQTEHEQQLVQSLNEKMHGYFDYAHTMWSLLKDQAHRLTKQYGKQILFCEKRDMSCSGETFHDYIHLTIEAQDIFSDIILERMYELGWVESNTVLPFSYQPPQWKPFMPYSGRKSPDLLSSCELHIRLGSSSDSPVLVKRFNRVEKARVLIDSSLPPEQIEYRCMNPLNGKVFRDDDVFDVHKVIHQAHLRYEEIPLETFHQVLPTEYEPTEESLSYSWVTLERMWGVASFSSRPCGLEIVASPPSSHTSCWMFVSVDNREIAAVPMEPLLCRYRIFLPEEFDSVEGRILIEFAPAYTPAQLGVAPDPRILSAKIYAVSWILVQDS